jgi:hypothetical protein
MGALCGVERAQNVVESVTVTGVVNTTRQRQHRNARQRDADLALQA